MGWSEVGFGVRRQPEVAVMVVVEAVVIEVAVVAVVETAVEVAVVVWWEPAGVVKRQREHMRREGGGWRA